MEVSILVEDIGQAQVGMMVHLGTTAMMTPETDMMTRGMARGMTHGMTHGMTRGIEEMTMAALIVATAAVGAQKSQNTIIGTTLTARADATTIATGTRTTTTHTPAPGMGVAPGEATTGERKHQKQSYPSPN